MKLTDRRGASSRLWRARFRETEGKTRLLADEWVPPRTTSPFEITPLEARLYSVLEATSEDLERAARLGFSFVPVEPPLIVLDEKGTEHAGEIHALKDGGALYVDGARVWPGVWPETRVLRFRAITPLQRDELKSFGYFVAE